MLKYIIQGLLGDVGCGTLRMLCAPWKVTISSAQICLFLGEIPNSHPINGWLTVKISTSTENSPLSQNMRFPPRRTSKVMNSDPFGWIEGWSCPWKLVWLNKKCCFEVLRIREITLKSPLLISYFWKKWHGNPDDWEIVTKWKSGSFTLKHSPFDAQGEMGTFRLIYKENRDSENGIPWLWRRWWLGMVIPFPHQKARCFSIFFPLIKR